MTEYWNNAPSGTFVGQWLREIYKVEGRIVYRDGNLSADHKYVLLGKLRFDQSDLPFVAVAAETTDRLLVSEESDYTTEVKEYLLTELGIRVLSIEKALALAREP